MPTYQLLKSTVLSSNTTSVTFSAIPQSYSDLEIRVFFKSTDTTATGQQFRYTFNNEAISFNSVRVANNMSAFESSFLSNNTFAQSPGLATSTATSANAWGFNSFYLGNYANGSYRKSALAKGTFGINGTSASQPIWGQFIHSTMTTDAINSITLTDTSGGAFMTGSRFDLYVIK